MRAYRLVPGAGLDGLQVVEKSAPRPQRRQVLVRVAACSLNARDLGIAAGVFPALPELTPLSDAAGVVAEIGPDVAKFKVGDRVISSFFQNWPAGKLGPLTAMSALGGPRDGVLADYVVLEEDGVAKCPASLSFEQGAALPCAGVTAWRAVAEYGQVGAGDTVLILGTGGVSLFALQIAKARGARVVATSSSAAKLARLSELGADVCINYKENPDWDREVVEKSGGGVDLVVEVGGAGTFAKSLASLRIGGNIALIGALAKSGEINPLAIMQKRANVQGVSVGSLDMSERLGAAVEAFALKPIVDRVFPFEEAREAYGYLQAQRHFGKIVISVDNP